MASDSESKSEPASESKSEDTSVKKHAEERPPGPTRRDRAKGVANLAGKASNELRNKIAQVVWLIAVAAAVILAVGALLVALDANSRNEVVKFFTDFGNKIDGPFNNLFKFDGKKADVMKKQLLVNHGLAAIVYLIVGKVLGKVIRPGS